MAASSRLRSIVRRLAETLTTTNGSASAVGEDQPDERSADPPLDEQNIPIAMITTGTISGEHQLNAIAARPGSGHGSGRAQASVPRTVVMIAVRTATMALFTMPTTTADR